MNLITNAMVAAQPGGCRIDDGDWYVAEDLIYPFDHGAAIQNTALGGHIRIFGNGCKLLNLPGGGPFDGTQAWGLRFFACNTVEIRNLVVGYGLELGKFYMPIDIATYTDVNGVPDYSSIVGRHVLDDVTVSGWGYGSRIVGNDCIYRRVDANDCGHGTAYTLRPIGIDHWGPRATMVDCNVINMVRGPLDAETMHYHFEDADDGVVIRARAYNSAINSMAFGVWFNSSRRMSLIEANFSGMGVVFSGDLHDSRITGPRPTNFITLSGLPSGNVLAFK